MPGQVGHHDLNIPGQVGHHDVNIPGQVGHHDAFPRRVGAVVRLTGGLHGAHLFQELWQRSCSNRDIHMYV